MRAWRAASGAVTIGKNSIPDAEPMNLPCGKCLGCREAYTKAWALRCQLEFAQHNKTAFTTLTYDDKRLPPTLSKRDLQLFLKKLRKRMGTDRPVRFFASGEYGETTYRPHYHAILFGLGAADDKAIDQAWGKGHTRTIDATPATINYVAGYTAKKLGDPLRWKRWGEMVDPATGEVYDYQPPFLQMSRKPGIAGDARKHRNSWREFAICNGTKQAVPAYLHKAWKDTATEEEKEQLDWDRAKNRSNREIPTHETRDAQESILHARQMLKAGKRQL